MEKETSLFAKINEKENHMYQEFFKTAYKMTAKKRTQLNHRGLDKPTYTDDLVAVEMYEREEEAHREGQKVCVETFKKREEMIRNDFTLQIQEKDNPTLVHYYYTVERIHMLSV